MRDIEEPGPDGAYELDGGPMILDGLLIRAWETDSADWTDPAPEPVTVTLRAYRQDGSLAGEMERQATRVGGALDVDVNAWARELARRHGV